MTLNSCLGLLGLQVSATTNGSCIAEDGSQGFMHARLAGVLPFEPQPQLLKVFFFSCSDLPHLHWLLMFLAILKGQHLWVS